MYIGYGQGFAGISPHEEERLFYRGYGEVGIDRAAMAFYRYEHIVEDIAVECDHIFSTDSDREDRERSFRFLTSNFEPGNTIECSMRSDTIL